MSKKESGTARPIVIKKYANRRLYNTATSSYVTLGNLSQMVRDGTDFVVHDAKTGEDITRPVLTQIIVEEEQKGQNLLPIGFLRELIGFYGHNIQKLVPSYLDYAITAFSRNQEQLAKSAGASFGGMFPFGPLEEMGKQNMTLFEQALKMFVPADAKQAKPSESPVPPSDPGQHAVRELTERLNELQRQIEALSKSSGG